MKQNVKRFIKDIGYIKHPGTNQKDIEALDVLDLSILDATPEVIKELKRRLRENEK